MPYILIDIQGQGSFGGYLSIDGAKAIQLYDGMMIEIACGAHDLKFSSESSVDRVLYKANLVVGNYDVVDHIEKHAVDCSVTEHFSEKSAMLLTVVCDSYGHILESPTYKLQEFDPDTYHEIKSDYLEQVQDANHITSTEFWLCLLLGWLGAHKFYRGKGGMGILYLFTCGLFFFGWGIDTIILLTKYIKYKRS